jgi:hypothetical protein
MGISVQKCGWVSALIITPVLLFSCAKKSDVNEAQGDLSVQIGVQQSASAYTLQVVTLKGIEKLNEVAGQFARFFYSPGSTATSLTGTAPHAEFIHSGRFFVPSDNLSMQMAAIYFHLQSLAAFDKEVGADGVNRWPRAVGLETQILNGGDGANLQQNNAFYNGQTDSMMFVPFTGNNLPIAVNAGIIAHEHFHSLFYKTVIRVAFQAQKLSSPSASIHEEAQQPLNAKTGVPAGPVAVSDKERIQMFNETFLRGINEGLADFWGWVYTDDPEFMRWSLPDFQADRTLKLSLNSVGSFETKDKILRKVVEATQFYENPKAALINYSYQIGTPYARFLKQLSVLQATAKKVTIKESKKLVAQMVFSYIKGLGQKLQSLGDDEELDPSDLFNHVADLAKNHEMIHLDQPSCEFVAKYVSQGACKQQKDSSFLITKP